ncbi:redoxin family protein [Bdellovibrio bacteriovorus]|uniref:redoxin family protein n=1 Tax=Bdellovibrio bacteriovorus TaxID=959 RepID=UPI0035A88151
MKHLFYVILLSFFSWSAHASLQSIQGFDVVTEKEQQLQFPSEKSATIAVFISAKCPCSASHEDVLKNLSAEFKEFSFVGIHSNSDEPADFTKKHFEDSKLPFPVLQDKKNILANKLGALKTPHVFVFNKDGDVIYQGGVTDCHVGPSAKKNYLKDVLEDLRAGKTPRHKEGKALGCYIQREDEE